MYSIYKHMEYSKSQKAEHLKVVLATKVLSSDYHMASNSCICSVSLSKNVQSDVERSGCTHIMYAKFRIQYSGLTARVVVKLCSALFVVCLSVEQPSLFSVYIFDLLVHSTLLLTRTRNSCNPAGLLIPYNPSRSSSLGKEEVLWGSHTHAEPHWSWNSNIHVLNW